MMLLAGLTVMSGCAHKPESFLAEQNIPYVHGGGIRQQGDLYLPKRDQPAPVAVVIHGGGWTGRDRSDMEEICTILAREGVASFNINYRLAPEHVFPAQREDVEATLRKLPELAKTYPLDLEEVYLMGYSAGAHLALLASMQQVSDAPPVRGVLAGGAPTDLTRYPDSPYVQKLMGDPPASHEEASPFLQIDANHPPTYLYHGRPDLIVGLRNSTRYRDRLREVGVPVKLEVRNMSGHLLTFLWSERSIRRGIRFLQQQQAQVED